MKCSTSQSDKSLWKLDFFFLLCYKGDKTLFRMRRSPILKDKYPTLLVAMRLSLLRFG